MQQKTPAELRTSTAAIILWPQLSITSLHSGKPVGITGLAFSSCRAREACNSKQENIAAHWAQVAARQP